MKKTKFDQRFEKAVNAFFENEQGSDNQSLAFADTQTLAQNISSLSFAEKMNNWFGVFKKIFLFLPGAFVLYFAVLTSVFFMPTLGLNVWNFFWVAAGGFMVWAGLGDLKNKNHFFLPLSVVVVGLILVILFSFLPETIKEKAFFEYSIYFFPLVLTAPHLVKNLFNDKSASN